MSAQPLPEPDAGLGSLLTAARGLLPLPALDPDRYAAGHDAFEARSTQRGLLTARLCADLLAGLAGRDPVSVLSVGCGDGSVDVVLARALAADGRSVRYDGVDPHAPSAGRFLVTVGGLPGVTATATVGRAGDLVPDAAYGAVLAVHSLYYVADLPDTLAALAGHVAPGGALRVVLAPLGELNTLAAAMAPHAGGSRQWWSEDMPAALDAVGLTGVRSRLRGVLSLDDCLDPTDPTDPTGRLVLDFAVQGVVPDSLREPVLDHLVSVRRGGQGLRIDHPVDVWTVRVD